MPPSGSLWLRLLSLCRHCGRARVARNLGSGMVDSRGRDLEGEAPNGTLVGGRGETRSGEGQQSPPEIRASNDTLPGEQTRSKLSERAGAKPTASKGCCGNVPEEAAQKERCQKEGWFPRPRPGCWLSQGEEEGQPATREERSESITSAFQRVQCVQSLIPSCLH